ncbi:hypothetical protein TNCV_2986181 [Trichonephila clavipes]|nr:hypothetical protein TNCV_2986181 [Trichonephila clavipes]
MIDANFQDYLKAIARVYPPHESDDQKKVTRDLNQLLKDRNRARKTWHYTRSPADKNTLNKLQKQIKKIIRKFEQKQWDESLACLEAEDGTLWKAVRDFRKKPPEISALPKLLIATLTKARSLQTRYKINLN